jgi:parallel beta-helix repeat protein
MKKPFAILFCLLYFLKGFATDTLYITISKETQDKTKSFKTLEDGLTFALEEKKIKEQPTVIIINENIIRLSQTLALDEKFKFSREAPLIIRNQKDKEVIISGSINVPQTLVKKVTNSSILSRVNAKTQNNLYEIDLGEIKANDIGHIQSTGFRRPYKPTPVELILNNKPQQVARFPNDNEMLLEKVIDKNGKFICSNSRISNWTDANDAWINGTFFYGWADDMLPIKEINSKDQTITTAEGTMFSFDGGKAYQKWYIFNLLSEIDLNGEYYIDRTTGKLYFFSEIPAQEFTSIEISYLKVPLLSLKGCTNISVEGIIFENSRGLGIYFENGENNRLLNCTIRNIGEVGVSMGLGIVPFQNYVHNATGTPTSELIGSLYEHLYDNPAFNREGGFNNGIENCKIYACGMGGIVMGGGDRISLKAAGNYVKYTEICDINRLAKTYKGAVNVDGVGNIIENNYIHDVKQVAIYINGNDHIIKGNFIEEVCTDAEDMGAIYIGRDPSSIGHIISNNYLKNISPENDAHRIAGIYLDDGMVGIDIENNFFENVGNSEFGAIFIHGGHAIKIENNIFFNCKRAVGNTPWNADKWEEFINEKTTVNRLYNTINIKSPAYKKRYPNLENQINSATRKITVLENGSVNTNIFTPPGMVLSNNIITRSAVKEISTISDIESINKLLNNKNTKFKPLPITKSVFNKNR